MELPEEAWFEVLQFVPPLFYFVLEDVCVAWREFVRARTPEFRGPPWCRLRPPRVDVAALARQGHGALLEAAERAGKFSWTDRFYDADIGYDLNANVNYVVRVAARCGHADLVHRLLARLPSYALYVQAIGGAAHGGHASLMFDLVERSLARLPTIEQTLREQTLREQTLREQLYSAGLCDAAAGRRWSLVYQLVDLVDLAQCKRRGYDKCVIGWAVKFGEVEAYSYLSKKLDYLPSIHSVICSGSVEMLEAVIADGHAPLEEASGLAYLSPNMAMFDALGAPPAELDWCFIQSCTAELARALRARGAKVPANYDEASLSDHCDEWWYCELVIASYFAALPDRAAALERLSRRIAANASCCDCCHLHLHSILANLVKLGAAPRSPRCVCSR